MTRVITAIRVTFRSLSIRNFRLYFVGQLISQIGTWLTQIALTLLMLHLTDSGVAIGFLVACQFGPVLVFGAYGGVIADRADKRRLLITTQTLQMVQSFVLAAFAFMDHPPIGVFYATALAGGFILAFDNPVRRSFVSELVPESEMHNAVTLNSAIMTSSRIFGPAIAGLLVVTAGYGWAFAVDGLSYLAVLTSLFMMRSSELHASPRSTRGKGQIRDGLRYIRRVDELWVPMVMVAIIGAFTFNFAVTLPLFVKRSLDGSDGTYTLVYSVLSIGSFVGALVAAHRHVVTVDHIVKASFGFGVTMCLLALSPNLAVAFPVALVVGFTSIAFMATANAIMQVRADPVMRGRVLALQSMVLIGTTPIGGPLLGAVCEYIDARAGLIVGGVAAVAAAAWGRAHMRRSIVAASDDNMALVESV
ncbi:MAG: MFS transporter [Acidimicrobiia bacterium]